MINIPIIVDVQQASIANEDKVVLNNISFRLADGEMVYIIGKSGSGKSSFIKTLYGENPVAAGIVSVCDVALQDIASKELPIFRRKLGIVFQDFHLLKHWTVQNNLEYVLKATDWKDKSAIAARVEEVLEQIGLLAKLDTVVSSLSGGEQQKIAIARAILNKPALILADEPTGNLDPESSDEIMYLLHKVANENKTAIIIATHDYRLIDKFPARIYECKDGNLTEK